MLGQIAHAAGKLPGACAPEGFAQKLYFARRRCELAGKHLEQGGLAGAVMPEQGGYLTLNESEVQVLKNGGVANANIETGNVKKNRHAGSRNTEGLQDNLNANHYQYILR
jgi:hypothetical protein